MTSYTDVRTFLIWIKFFFQIFPISLLASSDKGALDFLAGSTHLFPHSIFFATNFHLWLYYPIFYFLQRGNPHISLVPSVKYVQWLYYLCFFLFLCYCSFASACQLFGYLVFTLINIALSWVINGNCWRNYCVISHLENYIYILMEVVGEIGWLSILILNII